MRQFKFFLIFLVVSCKPNPDDWKSQWTRDNLKLKEVVSLLKQGRLKLVSPRGTYQIPDSIDLKEPYGQLVYRQTDFTYDSTFSIVFYPDDTHKDESKFVFVFTDNAKRINEYQNKRKSIFKIDDYWYCLDDSYSIENIIKN
jgi:uncharacterized secreted protein with C-terminal beta-propeller domain